MTGNEMVTDFKLGEQLYTTPTGTATTREEAEAACKRCDFDPALCITPRMEMAKVKDLMTALNKYCGHKAEEYDFSLAFRFRDEPEATIPEQFWQLVAFAVEGGSEGYYTHVGAIIRPTTRDGHAVYVDFGFCKTNTADNAYEIARDAQRFLTAARWN